LASGQAANHLLGCINYLQSLLHKITTISSEHPTGLHYGQSCCSAARNLICQRRTKTVTGARAFGVVAPNFGTTYLTLYDLATLLPQFLKKQIYLYNQVFTS